MTNTAVVSDNAIAQMESEDAQQTLTESMVGDITTLFDRTLEQLIALRDSAYESAIKELDQETEALAKEYGQLEEGIRAIEAVLPSKRRVTQHAADELLLNGAKQDAANKLAELAEFERKPVAMRERQKECIARLEAIANEKRTIAKQMFENWYTKVRPVIRAAERGLLITLLQGLEESLYQYQATTGMGKSDNKHRPLVHQGHITGLTADGRSAEWAAGHKWYG